MTPGAGLVLTLGASYEQSLERSTRRCYKPNTKALHLLVSEKRILKFSFFVPMLQTCHSQGGASFDPRGIIWTILVVHKEMLHTKNIKALHFLFSEKRNFKVFLLSSYVLNLWHPPPPPGAGQVLTPGASYEQSWYRSTRRCYIPNIKALHHLVSEKKNFKVFLLCSYVSNLWPLGRGQFWPPGASYEQSWYRSTKRCYIQNIKALHLLVSEKKIFKDFASFEPRVIICTILVEVH